MLNRFAQRLAPLRTFALAGAWFFIAFSFARLLWVVGAKWVDPSGTYKLLYTVIGDRSYDALGLTYTGLGGLLSAMAQAALVAAAVLVTVPPLRRNARWRHIGHGVLCGWSALWALNLVWLAGVDQGMTSFAQATLLCLLCGCTGYRAVTGWTGPSGRPKPGSLPSPPPPPHPEWPQPVESSVWSIPPDDNEPHTPGPEELRAQGQEHWLATRLRQVQSRMVTVLRQLKPAVAAVLGKVGAGLVFLAEFARRQARRLAPTSDSSTRVD